MDDIVKGITAPFILSAGWLVSFFLALFLIHQYSSIRTQNPLTTLSTLAIWFLSLVTIFILPVDVSSAFYTVCLKSYTGSGGLNDSETSCDCGEETCGDAFAAAQCDKPYSFICGLPLKIMWYIIYWVFFVLSWVVLPLVQSYVVASYFNVWKKILRSIVENVIMYASLLVVFLILLISLLANNLITFSDLPLLISTASNMWGLLIVMLLLGYGLVEVPRWLLDASRVQYSLNRCYFKAAKLYEEMTEANEQLEEITERVKKIAQTLRYNDPLRKYIDVIIKKFPEDVRKDFSKGQDDFEDFKEHSEDVLTKSSLEGVLKKTINGNRLSQSTKVQWIILADEALALEDVVINGNSSNKHFQSSIRGAVSYPKWTKGVPVDRILSALEWYWKIWLRPWVYRILFVLTTLLSLVIVWSEITFNILHPRLSIFAIIIYGSHDNSSYAGILIISMLIVGYMSICSYFTLFRIRIFNLYHLVPRHLTDEYSLLFSAVILSRLAIPVCLNYLYMINVVPIREDNVYTTETAFAEATGIAKWLSDASNSTRFSNPIVQFNKYYPTLIPIICLATLFSLGTRIASCLGYQKFLGGDEYSEDFIVEGKALMKRERRLRERKLREHGREEEYNQRKARLQMTLDLMKESSAPRPRPRPEEKPSRFAELMKKVQGDKGDRDPPPAVKYSSRRRRDEEMGQDSSTEQGDEVTLIPMEERRERDLNPPPKGSTVGLSRGRTEGSTQSTHASAVRDSSPKAAAKKSSISEGTSKAGGASKPPTNSERKSSNSFASKSEFDRPSTAPTWGKGASKAPPTSISIPRPKPSVQTSIEPKVPRPPSSTSGVQKRENPRDLFSNI